MKIDIYMISFSIMCNFSCSLGILCSPREILMFSVGVQNCLVWFWICALHIKMWLFSACISPRGTHIYSCNFLLVNSKSLNLELGGEAGRLKGNKLDGFQSRVFSG